MTALIEIALGMILGVAGFYYLVVDPYKGCGALLLSGFLVIAGFEKSLSRKPVESEAQPD